jgi:hypothetical protein
VASVRERTIPTERPPLVGEVSASFCGWRGVAWSVRRIPYGHNLGFHDRFGYSLSLWKSPVIKKKLQGLRPRANYNREKHNEVTTRILIIYCYTAQISNRTYLSVVKALCYKPEGRGSEIRWNFFFLIYQILPAALGPWVHSASNKSEYQKQENNNVSGE